MAQASRSVFQRINSVKSSLENAEQSFLDNNGMRGELDLMLAEAELKNLRRKQDLPWSWNRQFLAMCVAMLVSLAGVTGWYYAKGDAPVAAEATAIEVSTQALPLTEESITTNRLQGKNLLPSMGEAFINKLPAARQANNKQVNISDADVRRLVQSARVELSNSK